MILNRAIKMRIYPDDEQRHKIDVTLGHCRYIYNKMLERNTVIYKRRKEHLNYYAMQNLLPEMKKYLPWLKEADSQALKYACRQVNNAFERFFPCPGWISEIPQQTRETVLYDYEYKEHLYRAS